MKECIDSIFFSLQRDLRFEIIVVDNASSDDSLIKAKDNFPAIKYIENKINMGFAKAANQSINISSGKYILLLNSDTLTLDKSIQRMFHFMEKNKDVGVLGCKMIRPDNSIHRNVSLFPWLLIVLQQPLYIFELPRWFQRKIRLSSWDYNSIEDADWLLSTYLLIRRDVLNRIGLLDERFFIYAEDIDLCYRVTRDNFRIAYFPYATIMHYQNITGAQKFGDRVRLMEYISIQKLFEKYAGRRGLILGFITHVIDNLIKIFFYTSLLIFNWGKRGSIRPQIRLWLFTLIRIIRMGWNARYPEYN